MALEYAHRYEHEYGLIWQAALLGVRDLVDAADPVRQVHAALAARPDQ